MSSLYRPNEPGKEEVALVLTDANLTLKTWTSYAFTSNFLQPTDAFHFEIGEENLPPAVREALVLHAPVQLSVNAATLATGYVDSIEIRAERNTGVVYNISGRDKLSVAVDGTIPPKLQIKEGESLLQGLKRIFEPYGWGNDEDFIIDNADNRSITMGTGKLSKSKKHPHQPLASQKLRQCHGLPHEGAFAFASRVAQREGLWIWATANGSKLVVGKPATSTKDQDPEFGLRRDAGGHNNMLSGSAHFDLQSQPSVIFADAWCSSAEFGSTRHSAYGVNPFCGVDAKGQYLPGIAKVLLENPDYSHKVDMGPARPLPGRNLHTPVRPVFLHDPESHKLSELDAYIKRELSLYMRKTLTFHAKVEGHFQIGPDGEARAWAPDTIVRVDDSVSGVHQPMYCLSRTFMKSRSGGTHTELELIPESSLFF